MNHAPLPIEVRRLHHVGWIVPGEEAFHAMLQTFALDIVLRYRVEAFDAECIFLGLPQAKRESNDPAAALLEVVIPSGGVLARFNKGRGGLHHVAYEVDDLDVATASLIEAGLPPVEPSLVEAGPFRVSFLPPAVTRGLTVELLQTRSNISD